MKNVLDFSAYIYFAYCGNFNNDVNVLISVLLNFTGFSSIVQMSW